MKWFNRKQIKNIINNQYTSEYFIKTKKILNCMDEKKSTMQFICFNDIDVVVAGIYEIIELIRLTLTKKQLKNIEVYAQAEGTIINKDMPILKIVGKYADYCFLENIIDGLLAQRCSVATNVYHLKKSLKVNQKFIYMADRSNNYFNQEYDGYAAYVGGARLFTTQAQVKFIDNKSDVRIVGTMPHALIQQYKNNLKQLIRDYNKTFKQKPIVLIDFENDVIKTLNEIKDVLHLCQGIRIDTSSNLVDKSLIDIQNANGVSVELIKLVNNWLIENNFNELEIYISSSLNEDKIKNLNNHNIKINCFGIGSALLKQTVSITADLVKINDNEFSKFGRKNIECNSLIKYI